jgi:hypothetical protein
MSTDEALKLAREALEEARTNDDSCEKWDKEAITAIKEALAQPPLPVQPVQRPWVGLTDDEVYKIAFALEGEHWRKVADAIEAKLKEKNT